MKIGIFGGTFNPPHFGHLISASVVKEKLLLDKFFFVPAKIPPHKISTSIIDANLRVEMLKLAISKNQNFDINEIEITRKGISYTIDTLIFFEEKFPKSQLFLIIGMDNLFEIHLWKNVEKIFEIANIVVMNRANFSLPKDIDNKFLKQVQFVEIPNIEISSTEIRHRIKMNRSIKYFVPEAVEKFILKNNLYV